MAFAWPLVRDRAGLASEVDSAIVSGWRSFGGRIGGSFSPFRYVVAERMVSVLFTQ